MPKDLLSNALTGPRDLLADVKPPRQTKRGLRQITPYIDRVSAAAGVPVVDKPDLSWKERADLGLSDTFKEKQAKFMAANPQGRYFQVQVPHSGRTETLYQRASTLPVFMADEPGIAPGDVLDRPQEAVTLPIQAGLTALGPPGWAAQAGLQAAVPALTHLGKEGIEALRGYQKEPVGGVLGTAVTEGVGDLISGGIPGGLTALARGPVRNTARRLTEDYRDITNLLRTDPNVEGPMPYQLRPDKKMTGRMAAQAGSTSEALSSKLASQEQSISDFLVKEQRQRLGKAGVLLDREARTGMNKEAMRLRRDFNLDPAEAGAAIQGIFTEDFHRRSREVINKAYAEAGRAAKGVKFDLSDARSVAGRVTDPTMAKGRPLTTGDVEELVKISADPEAVVTRVKKLLNEIDPVQSDWNVVKELRSQVGTAHKDIQLANGNSGQAMAIYRALTEAMDNPVGGGEAFRKAWRKANSLAKSRFDVYNNGNVLKLMGEASPAEVANKIATDPTFMNPTIMGVIDSYVPEKKAIFKKALVNRVLGDPKRTQLIDQWDRTNPAAINWVLGDRAGSQQVRRVARNLDALERLPIKQFLDSREPMIRRGAELLNNTGPREIEKTIAMLGGRKSDGFQAMRMFAYDDILTRGSTISKDGLPIPDGKKMAKLIREYQERGIWDKVLTKQDKAKIKGLGAYARRVLRSMSDTGTSLEQAQAIAALKHPSTMLQGVHALAVNNRILAPLMMSERWSKLIAPSPKAGRNRGRRSRGMVPAMTFVGNLTESMLEIVADDLQLPE